jgi:2-polyprenyl-6-methoxyphenol hydroxylase-like FAD-dependent oxidoreductase
MSNSRGRVAVIGAGPGGMAAAIAFQQAGHEVALFERYPESRPAGNILNLWPPPLKALRALGVDIQDLGAPCDTEFRSSNGKLRVTVKLPEQVKREYGGGFIGLLRPELYERLNAALPPNVLRVNHALTRMEQNDRSVIAHFANGEHYEADILIGADGIDSVVRSQLWGQLPKREHNLHIIGGFCFSDEPLAPRGLCILTHDRVTQGSWTSIRYHGRDGYQWWVLRAWKPEDTFAADLIEYSSEQVKHWAGPLPKLIAATDGKNAQRWIIRDRAPLKQWSQGRITLLGDAAHPTSPYAAYGAGMAIEDAYFLGRELRGKDLRDQHQVGAAFAAYEERRRPFTRRMSQTAFVLGRVFHHGPYPWQLLRDTIFDHTQLLQKVVGDSNPDAIMAQLNEIEDVPPKVLAVQQV